MQSPSSRPPDPGQVPPHVIAASRAALGLHDASLAVAALVADSLLAPELDVPEGADRHLVFRRGDLVVDVLVWHRPADAELHVLVGRAVGGVDDDGDEAAHPLDALGDAVLELVQPTVRTRVSLQAGEAVLSAVKPGLTSLVLPGPAASAAVDGTGGAVDVTDSRTIDLTGTGPGGAGSGEGPGGAAPGGYAPGAGRDVRPVAGSGGVRTAWFTV